MSDSEQRIRELEEQLAREVAARHELEHSLRESDARFRSMARNLTEMVLAYDMDRRLTYVNPAVHTLTGYSLSDLEKEHFICWVHPDGSGPHAGLLGPPVRGPFLPRGRVPPGDQRRARQVDVGILGPAAGRYADARWACRGGSAKSQSGGWRRRRCGYAKSAIGRCSRTRRFRCGRKTFRASRNSSTNWRRAA